MSRTSAGLAPGGCALSNALEVRSWPSRKTPAGKRQRRVVRVRCIRLEMVIRSLSNPDDDGNKNVTNLKFANEKQ